MQTQTQAERTKQNYRVDELATLLDMSEETIRRWIRLKLIKAVHMRGVWRIPADEYARIRREGVNAE